MKTRLPVWMAVLSIVVSIALLVSALSFGPALAGKLSPQVALAEDLPPEVSSPAAQLQATGTLHTLCITTAAFVPQQDGVDWFNDGNRLFVNSGSGTFLAPVFLPQGAKVTKMVVVGFDNNPAASYQIQLTRAIATTTTWGAYGMAGVTSTNSSSTQKNVTDNIYWPTVNYVSYSYFLRAELSGPSVSVYTVKIQYYY